METASAARRIYSASRLAALSMLSIVASLTGFTAQASAQTVLRVAN